MCTSPERPPLNAQLKEGYRATTYSGPTRAERVALPRFTPSYELVQAYRKGQDAELLQQQAWLSYMTAYRPTRPEVEAVLNRAIAGTCHELFALHGDGYELSITDALEDWFDKALERRLELPSSAAIVRRQIRYELVANLAHRVIYRFGDLELLLLDSRVVIQARVQPTHAPAWLGRLLLPVA